MQDAHAHLSDPRLKDLVEAIVPRLQAGGVTHIVLGGVNPREWLIQEQLLTRYPGFVTPVMGIHPWTVRDAAEDELAEMFSTLKAKAASLRLIGEVGLDFHKDRSPEQREKQIFWCERQLALAREMKKPVVLHCVKGHESLLSSIQKFPGLRGIIHGFRGQSELGHRYSRLGFLLSIGSRSFAGMPPAHFSWIEPDDFVIESDAPDLKKASDDAETIAGDWLRDLNSTSSYLASSWSMPLNEVWARSQKNLHRLFVSGSAVAAQTCHLPLND